MDYIQYTMEVTIIVKYGISEKDAIDVTKEVMPSYFTGNVINIPSTELLTFTPKFYTSWLNKNIEYTKIKNIST